MTADERRRRKEKALISFFREAGAAVFDFCTAVKDGNRVQAIEHSERFARAGLKMWEADEHGSQEEE